MSTIRGRVWIAATGATALALVTTGILVFLLVRNSLLDEVDRALGERALTLANAVEVDDSSYESHAPEALSDRSSFSITTDRGATVASHGDQRLLDACTEQATTITSASGVPYRCVLLRAHATQEGRPSGSGPAILVRVASDISEVHAHLRDLSLFLIVVGSAVSVIAGLTLRGVVRRALRPLDRVAGSIAAIDAGSLDRPVAGDGVPVELAPIVQRLNELLDRLRQSWDKEKRFNAAIAHELRTPLAGLRTVIQVYEGRERLASDYREGFSTCAAIERQMSAMVEALLILAQADAKVLACTPAVIPLAPLLRTAWGSVEERARARGIACRQLLDDDLLVLADHRLLSLIARNLFDNAVEHGEANAEILVEATRCGRTVVWSISNQGCTLTQDDMPRIFDRFWRADQARSRTGEHFGLGLALCRESAAAMNAAISARFDAGSFIVEVSMPAESAAPARDGPSPSLPTQT